MSVERYNAEAHATEAIRLGRLMQAEGSFDCYTWDSDKFLKFIEQPSVYCSLYRNGIGYVGGMIGFVSAQYFSSDLAAKELAIYIEPKSRGGMAAVRLVRDFEEWTIDKGVKEIYLGQSTGVEIEKTRKWFEALGYSVCGFVTKRRVH